MLAAPFDNRFGLECTPADAPIKLVGSASEPICDVFIKIGGSILDQPDQTAALIAPLVELRARYRMLVLVGGGTIAKRIKANQRKLNTDFYRCWRAGALCHDVNAGLLASYSAEIEVASSAAEMMRCFEAGKVAVFAATTSLINNLYFTPDWRITTDSMGAYWATVTRAKRYVIISNVDGMHETWPDSGPPIPNIKIADLERLASSKLDPAFPAFFRRYPLPTVIVNGKYPERVSQAIRGESTIGTEIVL